MTGSADITQLNGVGESKAKILHRLGIFTVYDLITYYPRDYEHCSEIAPISRAEDYFSSGDQIIVRVKIKSEPVLRYTGRYKILNCIAGDETGNIEMQWFGAVYLKKILKVGTTHIFKGTVKKRGMTLYISQAKQISEADYAKISGTLQPIYVLTKGITSQAIAKLVHQALTELPREKDVVLDELNKWGGFGSEEVIPFYDALMGVHFPTDMDSVLKARWRLVFNEFLAFILNVRRLKGSDGREKNSAPMIEVSATNRILESLPYSLTNAQLRTFKEILSDIGGEFTMNRLVQGDVGSGKTIVAFLALVTAAMNGYQAALMAPTEVLARQHFEELRDMVRRLHFDDVVPVFLTGSVSAKEKREIKEQLLSGKANIVLGTHAVIQDDVQFKKLGLVITDEQHRFGVRQRAKLSNANTDEKELSIHPHTLVMSATPIPRTLAIIIYGDLDISLIDELPATRLPIKNCVVGPNYRPSAYKFIRTQVTEGRQALVVCPMVEESEGLDAENVIDYSKRLKEELPDSFVIEYLHGKMKPKDKNFIMERFASGEIDVLVSTTVIEVGINVPNTTVMMVENSERFGLAQLHQLRGRVGRGIHQSYCIFMCGSENKDVHKRLDILNKSNDGFKIAEEDLKQRGPGDVFGVRQSGEMYFKIGDIYADSATLKLASEFADFILKNGSAEIIASLESKLQPVI